MTFEYHVESVDVPYKKTSRNFFSRERHTDESLEPNIQDLVNFPVRRAKVQRLGQEGWELVSVQPLIRGVTEIGNQNAQGWAWGVALPVSYLLFFKRATS
ncbi:TPA: hypothetical protein ACWMEO_004562 [Pseudomonas aeruginosa]